MNKKINMSKIFNILMFIIGVIALTVMIFLEVNALSNLVFIEVVDIFAWVFLWESVDLFFFERLSVKTKIKRFFNTGKNNAVLIIKRDGIGDFILFYEFFLPSR